MLIPDDSGLTTRQIRDREEAALWRELYDTATTSMKWANKYSENRPHERELARALALVWRYVMVVQEAGHEEPYLWKAAVEAYKADTAKTEEPPC